MDTEVIKRMFDACYLAKRTRDMLPPLPDGITPSYIHYLDVLDKIEKQGDMAKVSDISDRLGLPRPGVTRTVKDMVNKGYLEKISCKEDGRITYITMTSEGREVLCKYDRNYFKDLVPCLDEIPAEDAECMIRTIKKFYEIMNERKKHHE